MVSALRTWCMVAGAITGLAWGALLASAAPPPPLLGSPREGGRRVTVNKPVMNERQNHDHVVADWLIIGNSEEVEMAKLAETHAEHPQVRAFAEHMQKVHSDVMKQLEQFSRPNRPEPVGQPAAPVGGGLSVAQTTHTAQMRGEFNFLEAQRQIAAQCLATAAKEMGAKKGIEFDRAYIGSQIGAHYRMIDTQKVLREYASPELQKVIDKGIETAESHVEQATKIMHQLEGHDRSEK